MNQLAIFADRARRSHRQQAPHPLTHARQIAPTIDDTHDLDPINRAVIRVGMRFEENEIRPLDQGPRARQNIGAARPEPGVKRQGFGLGFNLVVQPFRRRWIIETDDDINVEQTLPSASLTSHCFNGVLFKAFEALTFGRLAPNAKAARRTSGRAAIQSVGVRAFDLVKE